MTLPTYRTHVCKTTRESKLMAVTYTSIEEPVDVLHVSEAYGGGVQTAVAQYIENSRRYSHELLVRVRSAHDVSRDLDVPTRRIEGSVPQFLIKAARYIRESRPRIVHLHSSFAGLLRAFDLGDAKVVYTPHSYAFLRKDTNVPVLYAYYGIERVLSQKSQVIAGISPHEVATAGRLVNPRRSKVTYLPNVVRRQGVDPPKKTDCDRRVVTVGRISAQKDPGFFLDTVHASSDPSITWTWVGDGDESMKQKLQAAGVEVTGWVPNDHVLKYIAQADLYFHPARWEGAPITTLEAASLGTPVLVREVETMIGLGYPGAGTAPSEAALAVKRFFHDPEYNAWVTDESHHCALIRSPEVQRSALDRLYSREN